MWYYFDGQCQGKWVVGEKGIKQLGYFEVIKPAIIFCDCKKAIKCILRVHYNDKNMGGFFNYRYSD